MTTLRENISTIIHRVQQMKELLEATHPFVGMDLKKRIDDLTNSRCHECPPGSDCGKWGFVESDEDFLTGPVDECVELLIGRPKEREGEDKRQAKLQRIIDHDRTISDLRLELKGVRGTQANAIEELALVRRKLRAALDQQETET